MTRAQSTCDQCGQSDDHPKVHLTAADGSVATKHHDCLAAAEKRQLVDSSPLAAQVIDACEGGLRGSDLLSHIESLHTEGV